MAIPSPSQFMRIAQRHWAERAHYVRASDWLLSIYNRVIIHARRLPLPGRRRVRNVRLAKVPGTLRVRLGSSDWYVLEEMFLNGEYAPLLDRRPQNVRSVLDLGANVGMSVRLWQSVWPEAKIVAVEPDAANVDAARQNVDHALGQKPVLVQACVAGTSRTVHLDRSKNEYSFKMQDGADDGEAIQALTVPQICEQGGLDGPIDLLKCDVEGAEAEVFASCDSWIGRVRYLVVETHAPYTVDKLMADLSRAGVREQWRQVVGKGDVAVVFMELAAPHA